MSQKNSMRRYLRQDNNNDTAPQQDGDIVWSFDSDYPRAFVAYNNGCKKVYSNDNPRINPENYRWDCPTGVDPPVDAETTTGGGGGVKGIDDDNYNEDDDGETLIYECIHRKYCNESSPGESSAEGWKFVGVCNFEGGVCPFPKYDKTNTYNQDDKVAVNVDKLLHECTDSSKCNENVPASGADVGNGDNGWTLFGGCMSGDNCNVEEFDSSKAASDEYKVGDDVFTNVGYDYGITGSKSGGGEFGSGEIDGNTGSKSGGGEFGFGEISDSVKLIYQCTDDEKCNSTSPTDQLADGWSLIGSCTTEGGCAQEYAGTDIYSVGDQVSVAVDRLIHECQDEGACNDNVPGASSGDDSWMLIGGCKAGRICNAEEFNTSKAARDEYNSGDDVFTRVGYDYGTIEGGGDEGGGNSDGVKLIYQCTDDEKCNSTSPTDPLADGWRLIEPCTIGGGCAQEYVGTDIYNVGDQVSVAVDGLLHECQDEGACNDNVPGASSAGWKLIGGCKLGESCNVEEFDTSKAARDEYNSGDDVFTRVGHDYGKIGDLTDSIYCPGSQVVDCASKTLVTYAYGVETYQVTDANNFLPRLEEQILSNLAGSILSCLKDERLRRKLEKYGVSGIESFPMDVVTDGFCTYKSAGADGCFAIDGGLTLCLSPGADSQAAVDSTRELLEEAMTNNSLLSPDIPEVVKVKYLGDSYDDYVDSLPGAGTGSITRPNDPDDFIETGTPGGTKGLPAWLIAMLAVLGALAIILLLCVKRRKNEETAKDDVHTRGEDSDLDEDLDDVIDRIGGIGHQPSTTFENDPPGSFHMGSHHYTENGVQYKSFSCAQCQASKSSNPLGLLGLMISSKKEEVDDLDLNDKNDLSFDLDLAKNFVDFSRNDLGRTHSSINVRHCKSQTCGLCKKVGGVVFVKSEL